MEENYICYECVGEDYLRAEVKKGLLVNCSYCDNAGCEGLYLSEFAHHIDIAFQQHYTLSPESPPDNWSIYQLNNFEYEPPGNPVIYVIADAANISEKIAGDVQQILSDRYDDQSAAENWQPTEYNDESYYDDKNTDDAIWQKQWTNFEQGLKTNARYYSADSERLLTSIFKDVHELDTHDNRPVVRYIGTKTDMTHLHRARAFQSEAKLMSALENPDKELGPPPPEYAAAGRMNARGISVFYGATNAKTALAEIRPPVGSKVVVAHFEFKRKLKVLDLSALTYTTVSGSIFDENYAEELSRIMFLRKLSQKMTKPIMPDDEHFEYLITQVISEYLASGLEFDGIIFPSAQSAGGLNVTLFHHASRVTTVVYPEGTEVEVRLSDWDGDAEVPDYKVIRRLSKEKSKKDDLKELFKDLPGFEWAFKDADPRNDSLEIQLNSIEVEHIESVAIQSKAHSVDQQKHNNIFNEENGDIIDY